MARAIRRHLYGHKATRTPLGPRRGLHQPIPEGWLITCICGWSATGPKQREVRDQYSTHLASTLPVCKDCGPQPPYKMSRATASLCKACSTRRTQAWAKAHPSEWERHRRKSLLKRKYGITLEQYDALLAQQGGVCAVCRDPIADPRGFRPHIDHDHETGAVRGVLCYRCNTGLGVFRDSVDNLAAAIEYLKRHRVRAAS